ncbi:MULTISPECIES: DNA polymerase III subunit chi [Cupriavidus]|jgi:DNA polymerase III subunit chi|uniref:DNA polymerase III subunit chi n=1 Tax=Cupriavidus metallidurans TaxID=119219 RepID=A0A482ITM7_9BURK|nr:MULTISPECIES: DNA polymerase III subunit chi [Cupriavidus]EKZ99720.1 DNA polymerase III subunit chi [Cupriavidus sp. HMR-1]KWR83278.1 DNA polymerase III subunit chi [Cupriavidus sp. SHE]QBP10907.1 DNA polymerase III subunit chi [Cupriavidus metallidurans]QWC87970.1 DNA polymerase III subunit chi [Cupriavidus metallidurans]GMG91069.1 DNA polymerase III subunit chi [Cupriavidus sp. TKC]
MTRIDFHSNVPDTLTYVCRLVRKAYGAGQKVVVHGAPQQLAQLDARLWSFSPLDFLPHCGVDSPNAAVTPIILAAALDAVPHHQLLVNLAPEAPAQFASFERLIEVVGATPEARDSGRERYRFYRERGYPLTHHDIGQAKGDAA